MLRLAQGYSQLWLSEVAGKAEAVRLEWQGWQSIDLGSLVRLERTSFAVLICSVTRSEA